MLQVCPNGARTRRDHPRLPVFPVEIAAAVAAATAAGATDAHVHPKRPDGTDTLDPAVVAAVVTAVRTAAPGIPVGVTTGAWTEPDPWACAAYVRSWMVLPDHASVNWYGNGTGRGHRQRPAHCTGHRRGAAG